MARDMTERTELDTARRSAVGRRARQVRNVWRSHGARGIALRVVEQASARSLEVATSRLGGRATTRGLRRADLMAADLTRPFVPPRVPWSQGEPMALNWVMAPPAPGSGGHTTAFRIIRDLERRGHTCRIYLYDAYGGVARDHEPVIRSSFPPMEATIHDVDDGMDDAHVVFATAWTTAYPVFNARCAGDRCYFVQDFEPWFYPVGAQSALAENTYRMGFHAVTAGRWLSTKLAGEFGMTADPFDFGCDTDRYRRDNTGARNGIVFYARPDAPRRAFEIGIAALEVFAAAHPDIDIHLYGATIGRLPFRAIDHGLLGVEELNDVYNLCSAGLSLSMTNVSLVPHEMLAAGCIPVLNDAEHNRIVLDNDHVRYAAPSPHALAALLGEVVTQPDFDEVSLAASKSVVGVSWEDARGAVEAGLMRHLGRD